MLVEFRKASVHDELDDLMDFDRRIFGSFPGDLFDHEDWNSYDSYWMFVNKTKVGCCAFQHGVDYDEEPRQGSLYIASTGILPELQGNGFGRKQKEWQLEYARTRGFSVVVTNMRQSNSRIIRLNESLGFAFRCMDPNYYTDPNEPAIVMELILKAFHSN